MSKNITIQEGGVAKQLTIDKLKTNLVGSGTCLWVPEDEVQLGMKNITANGTYKASDDGYYGYEQVVVSGVGSVTGTDGDGDEATVTTGGGGELVTTKIPSSIKVTTKPTKTSYNDGDAIDYSGMVVKAYLKTGGLYGTVPGNELLLPVTTAEYDETTEGSATSDVVGNLTQPIAFHVGSYQVERHYDPQQYTYWYVQGRISSGSPRVIANFGSTIKVYLVSDSTFSGDVYTVYKNAPTPGQPDPPESETRNGGIASSPRTVNGKTIYVAVVSHNGTSGSPTIDVPTYTETPNNNDFYTMVYGDITEGSVVSIPVLWNRPGDGSTLEAGFTITVSQN